MLMFNLLFSSSGFCHSAKAIAPVCFVLSIVRIRPLSILTYAVRGMSDPSMSLLRTFHLRWGVIGVYPYKPLCPLSLRVLLRVCQMIFGRGRIGDSPPNSPFECSSWHIPVPAFANGSPAGFSLSGLFGCFLAACYPSHEFEFGESFLGTTENFTNFKEGSDFYYTPPGLTLEACST